MSPLNAPHPRAKCGRLLGGMGGKGKRRGDRTDGSSGERHGQRRFMTFLDEAGLEPANDRLFQDLKGEGVEDVHIRRHDKQDDLESPGHIETQLDLGMGHKTLAQAIKAFDGPRNGADRDVSPECATPALRSARAM